MTDTGHPHRTAAGGPEKSAGHATLRMRRRLSSWAAGHRGGLVLTGAVSVLSAVLAAAALTVSAAMPAPAAGETEPVPSPPAAAVVAPIPVGAEQLAALPQATTFTAVPAADPDDTPDAPLPGRVVHPSATVPVYRAPGGPAIAALPALQLGSDTWLPVIGQQPGWARVLLPARPNGATGWLYQDDPRISVASTSLRIEVDRAAFTLTLLDGDRQAGRWRVGVGKSGSVTPRGRTFVLASIQDTHPTFSPIILPLGTHSDTYTSYGGGPGTVGIHTWPTPDVYGQASSDGCVRVPPDALTVLATQVPIGTPVLIR